MKNKTNNGLTKTKTNLVNIAGHVAACGLGYLIANTISNRKMAAGLAKFHKDGFLKFYNPSTGLEVNEKEVCDLIGDFYNLD